MKIFGKYILLFILVFCVQTAAFSIIVDRNHGYYVDERGQIPEYHRIAPPNEDKIPTSTHPTKTVLDFEKYYDINGLGIRRKPYMTPWIPNYNWHYSNRRAEPYTKQEFINVWCTGIKNMGGIDCQSEQYAITFVKAGAWAPGFIKAFFKAKKVHKIPVTFLMVDDIGLDAGDMHNAKDFAKLWNINIMFGTIDAFIPNDWLY